MELRRITGLPPYVFAELNELKGVARRQGVDVVDLGFGNPD
ncbi:MAG: alanine transaminase, partial [Actinomycetota bacterium]|nr:alanine transaminase [Actinomycetota bacterium]